MEQAKPKVFCFLLWYIPLFLSATGDKYFNMPSCMLINWIRTSYPNAAVFLLWAIPAVYIRFFSSRRFHRYAFVLFLADGLIGTVLSSNGKYVIWADAMGYRAYFWKPFFDILGISMKEGYLFLWGKIASSLLPSLLLTASIGFFIATPKKETNEREKGKLGHIMHYCGLVIALAICLYLVKYLYEEPAKNRQEFRQHLEAADRGNVPSMARVGFLYWDGDGTEYNTPEAIRWWEKGAEHGSADAMVFLGSAYYSGYRTGRDWDKARRWLTAVVETDPEKAKDARMILDRIDKRLLLHQWSQ